MIEIGMSKLLPFLLICVSSLAPSTVLGAAADRPAWCRRAGSFTVFNETIGKCVLGHMIFCKEYYPGVPSSSAVQCGSGSGGICGKDRGRCACSPGTYAHLLDPLPGSYGEYHDYTCEPGRSVGESCKDNSLSCAENLFCSSYDNDIDNVIEPVCKCSGAWNETERACYNERHCKKTFGETSFYDAVAKRCKCELGKPCNSSGSNENDLCVGNSTLQTQTQTEEVPSPSHICVCNEGFLPFGRGHVCLKPKGLGEACEYHDGPDYHDSACAYGTRCLEGVCQCPVEYGLRWDASLEQCVVSVDKECDIETDERDRRRRCTPNTICIWKADAINRGYLCDCPEGLQAYANGECGQPYGARCSRNAELATCVEGMGMACLDERCVCKDAVSQFYDETKHQCLSLIGSPCDGGDSAVSTTCVDSTSCDPGTGKCACDIAAGFIPSQNKARCFLALPHGANCTANQCDPAKGLICTDGLGKCVCMDSALVYSEAERACLAPIGSQCGEFEIEGSCLPMPTPATQSPTDSTRKHACEYKVIKCQSGTSCAEDTGICRQTVESDFGDIKSAPTQ